MSCYQEEEEEVESKEDHLPTHVRVYCGHQGLAKESKCKQKVLVYLPSNSVITSYMELEEKLQTMGWERYPKEESNLLQFHKGDSSTLLISLPRDFYKFKSMYMYDIVLKNRGYFQVQDL